MNLSEPAELHQWEVMQNLEIANIPLRNYQQKIILDGILRDFGMEHNMFVPYFFIIGK